jgi:hypothetical protein
MKLPFALLLLVTLLGNVAGTPTPPDQDITVGFDFDKAVDAIWADLPNADVSTESTKLDYVMGTQPACGAAATRLAKLALTESAIGPDAVKALKTTFKVAKVTLGAFGIPLGTAGDVADIMIKYLESNSPEEFAEKLGEFLTGKAASQVYGAGNKQLSPENPLKDNPYGKQAFKEAAKKFYKGLSDRKPLRLERSWDHPTDGTVYIIIDVHESASGMPELFFRASGDCHCQWPTNVSDEQKLGSWQVLGFAPLTAGTPIVKGTSVTIPWSVGKPHYEVTARCGCPVPTTTGPPSPSTTPPLENPRTQPLTPEEMATTICNRRCEAHYNTWQDELKKRESLGLEYNGAVRTERPAADVAALLDLYRRAVQRASNANLEYYKCLEGCYKQAVDNHLIPSVPEEIVQKANPTTTAPAEPAKTLPSTLNPSEAANPTPPATPSEPVVAENNVTVCKCKPEEYPFHVQTINETVETSDADIATAQIRDGHLVVTGKKRGEATITVKGDVVRYNAGFPEAGKGGIHGNEPKSVPLSGNHAFESRVRVHVNCDLNGSWEGPAGKVTIAETCGKVTLTASKSVYTGTVEVAAKGYGKIRLTHNLALDEISEDMPDKVRDQVVGKQIIIEATVSSDEESIEGDLIADKVEWTKGDDGSYSVTFPKKERLKVAFKRNK